MLEKIINDNVDALGKMSRACCSIKTLFYLCFLYIKKGITLGLALIVYVFI